MTETPTNTASAEQPVAETTAATAPAAQEPVVATPVAAAEPTGPDAVLRDYHEARRREDQWRIPQLLTALVTPILAFIGIIFNLGGMNTNANISLVLAITTGVAAALMGVEGWRWHRTAASKLDDFRTQYPGEAAMLLKEPA